MSKKMLIDATHAEETRVVVVDGNKVDEFDFESLNKRQLAGNIYLAKVTRVEPSLQAAFVDYGGNRHGFLAFSEIHPDYYQIPTADREALLREEAEYDRAAAEEAEQEAEKPKRRRRSRSKASSEGTPAAKDALETMDLPEVEGDDSGLVEDLPEGSAKADKAEPVADATQAEVGAEAEAEADATQPEATDAESTDAPVAPEAEETTSASDADDNTAEDTAEDAVETIEDAEEEEKAEIRRRKPRPRRYKIQEVIKVRQILLVQVVKEERGNKGAALTTYLSLAGRYCVLMPNTARGGGISRKITNVSDRKKLKDIAGGISVPQGAGLIIRTAGAQRTKTEIKRDYEYLLRQWEQIRELTLNSIAPAPIYEEGSLIKRSIRDLYSRDIDEVFVDGARGYREAKDYMKMLMPSHAKNVKHYNEALPLFSRYQVETTLAAMFNPVVQLRSGGYIVIDVTEALVAVDVNSGKATKEGSIEETALKTNLEAAEELARQAKLRDLAGLIVIDFIDMDERRNNTAVEKRLKDRLKDDRARIQVGRISGFGLLEMSRQRLRPGMIEATTAPCSHCHGTGRVRSPDSLALAILRELEEEGVRKRSREVLVTAPVDIANYMLNQKREHIGMVEARFGLSVRIEGDTGLISPDYKLERFKTATRILPERELLNDIALTSMPDEEDDEVEVAQEVEEAQTDAQQAEGGEDDQPRRKRRRRRRRGGKGRGDAPGAEAAEGNEGNAPDAQEASTDAPQDAAAENAEPAPEVEAEDAPKPKRRRSRKSAAVEVEADTTEAEASPEAEPQVEAEAPVEEAPKPKRRTRKPKAAASDAPAEVEVAAAPEPAPQAEPEPAPVAAEVVSEAPAKPGPKPRARASARSVIDEVKSAQVETADAGDGPDDDKPRKRGWWARAIGS